jgi:hypothetical protein
LPQQTAKPIQGNRDSSFSGFLFILIKREDKPPTADLVERMAIGLRQFLHQTIQDSTWGRVIVHIGLVTVPLRESNEQDLIADLRRNPVKAISGGEYAS